MHSDASMCTMSIKSEMDGLPEVSVCYTLYNHIINSLYNNIFHICQLSQISRESHRLLYELLTQGYSRILHTWPCQHGLIIAMCGCRV